MRRPELVGAYGVPARPTLAAVLAHPERALRYALVLRVLWAIRIGIIVGLVLILYLAHLLVIG